MHVSRSNRRSITQAPNNNPHTSIISIIIISPGPQHVIASRPLLPPARSSRLRLRHPQNSGAQGSFLRPRRVLRVVVRCSCLLLSIWTTTPSRRAHPNPLSPSSNHHPPTHHELSPRPAACASSRDDREFPRYLCWVLPPPSPRLGGAPRPSHRAKRDELAPITPYDVPGSIERPQSKIERPTRDCLDWTRLPAFRASRALASLPRIATRLNTVRLVPNLSGLPRAPL